MDVSEFQFPDVMSLRLASVYVDLGEQRLRALVREGKIKAQKGDTGAWEITKEALDEYKANRKNSPRGGRKDGKAWIIRVKHEKLQAVKDFLATQGIELEPRYNYARQKAYQEKRRKQKAAEKAAAAAATKTPATPSK